MAPYFDDASVAAAMAATPPGPLTIDADAMAAAWRRELHELECAAVEARADSDILAAVLAEDARDRVEARLAALERQCEVAV